LNTIEINFDGEESRFYEWLQVDFERC
jgi:hypothetical protein